MRKSGDGQPTRIIDVPLTVGMRTFETGYAIGPQPRALQNMLRVARSAGGRSFGWANVIGSTAVADLTDLGDPAHTNKYLLGLGSAFERPYAAGVFDTGLGASHLGLWDVLGNDAKHGAATVPITDDDQTARFPAAIAYWPTQATVYYSHIATAGKPRQFTLGVESEYAPLPVFRGAAAMIVHLDRLWLAVPNLAGFTATTTTIYYTDPLDPATIRANNFLLIPDQVRCMARASVGDLDASAQAHLIIGCRDSIYVLDGDPRAGNAVLRLLSNQLGIQAQTLIQETPYGAICLATDGELYLIPPGASAMQPIGTPVRNLFGQYANIPRANGPANLLWNSPYLYVWGSDAGQNALICDMTIPAQMEWTGPHANYSVLAMGGVRIGETASSGVRLFLAEQTGDATSSGAMHVYEVAAQTDGTQHVQTGYLFEPNHDMILRRVSVGVYRKAANVNGAIGVTVTLPDGTTQSVGWTPATTTLSQDDLVSTLVGSFPANPRGNFLVLSASGSVGKLLDLLWLRAEVTIVALQDSFSAR